MVLWKRQRERVPSSVPPAHRKGRLRTLRFGMVHQIGFLVLLSLFVFGIISGLIIRTKYRESLQNDLVAEGRNLAEGIARTLEGGLFQGQPDALQRLLHELRNLHGVLYILALDADGEIVSHSFSGAPPEALRQRIYGREGIHQIPYPGSPGAIDISAPTSAEGLASIHVGMDLGLVARRQENVPVIVWRIILVSVLCAASVAIIVYWRIIRPIHVIAEAIRRIGRGRFSGRVPIHCGGELGIVAASLELMYADLRRYHEQLEAKTKELEASKEELQRQNEEIKRAQAQMIRSEKFASMGQLAASIAHEISNPLAGILTYVKLIRRKLESGQSLEEHKETYRHYLLTMERETERCGNIVKNLLDFARSSEPDLREIDVHRVLEDTLFLLKFKLMMHDVLLEKDYGDVPLVSGDFGQLKQVFLNVILNALEAMKGSERRLYIRTSFHRESRSVLVEIQDTGEGISEENIYKVFDPFFTTKPRGTGMGLAVVYGILEKHNADINIDSEPDKGTKVTIQLNAAVGDAALMERDRRIGVR